MALHTRREEGVIDQYANRHHVRRGLYDAFGLWKTEITLRSMTDFHMDDERGLQPLAGPHYLTTFFFFENS